jgi:aldose 1-epimerase
MRSLTLLSVLGLSLASAPAPAQPRPGVGVAPFGTLPSGEPVQVYTLTNANGLEVRAIDFGGVILSLRVPDREGLLDDVVLGFDELAPYTDRSPYFGSLIGRYGNRIREGRFELDGRTYALAVNNGPNHLHGGVRGFDKRLWRAEPFERAGEVGVTFSYTSPDGEEGYPGTLDVRVTYTLTDRDELAFEYHATTDRATPVNLTQHTYFNLTGDGGRDILGHELMLNASHFTPVDATLIPTGEIVHVFGGPFDFTSPTAIGARIGADDEQLRHGGGYDHNFVLNGGPEGEMRLAARVHEPMSGRVMEVHTTEPGVQFYAGNFLDGTLTGKGGVVYRHRTGFCLETQHFPDSPNVPHFPSTILRPGEVYRSRTVYAFSVED